MTAMRTGQRGLTLIEFMVSIVIGMLMIAAIATLIANQSTNRSEVDRSGKMLENGRYALSTMIADLQMAGYWGERKTAPAVPTIPAPFSGTKLDPCTVATGDLKDAMGVAVQGYDADSTDLPSCISNRLDGTDVLVVRRLDPDMSAYLDGSGNVDLSKLTVGQVYLQTGVNTATGFLNDQPGVGADAATNATTFKLKKKDKTSVANTRKYIVHIYYISKCSVEVGGSCTGADGGTPIPTLKRVELSVDAGAASITCASCKTTIAEGIENLQIDYGTDTDTSPDGIANVDTNGLACPAGTDCSAMGLTFPYSGADWAKVVSVKVYLLARAAEKTPGFSDDKTYTLGTSGAASAAAADRGYKRHMFVQSVKLVNPAGWNLL